MTLHGGRVLVVDDDPVNRAILVGSLEAQGYSAGVACDGREALRALKTGEYDVVLLDLVMPVLDGFEVLRTMKEDDRLRSLPVIVVSALGGVFRGIQGGFVRSYAAVILFGALLVIGYFIYFGFKLIG